MNVGCLRLSITSPTTQRKLLSNANANTKQNAATLENFGHCNKRSKCSCQRCATHPTIPLQVSEDICTRRGAQIGRNVIQKVCNCQGLVGVGFGRGRRRRYGLGLGVCVLIWERVVKRKPVGARRGVVPSLPPLKPLVNEVANLLLDTYNTQHRQADRQRQ